MANLKISQLNQAGNAQTSDLVRIARPTGGGYLDWSASMDEISQFVENDIDPVLQSDVGAAGGVAPLDGAGLIDPQYLNITGTQYLGLWDATTNTPTISDAGGNAGDFYFVSVGGTIDLGYVALHLKNIRYSGSSDQYKLRNVNSGLRLMLEDVQLQGDPQTAADIVDTVGFPNIWEAGSTMPTSVRITPILA